MYLLFYSGPNKELKKDWLTVQHIEEFSNVNSLLDTLEELTSENETHRLYCLRAGIEYSPLYKNFAGYKSYDCDDVEVTEAVDKANS